MIAIDDVLIADDIVIEHFVCDLTACKGACCWEGDFGAPVLKDEILAIDSNLETIKEELSDESIKLIEEFGWMDRFSDEQWEGTALHPDGSCVFLVKNAIGISMCGIEKAHREGKIDYQKPLSCHLYPIRVTRNPDLGFEAWNYDVWDICSAACTLGDKLKIPIYEFAKDAIIRAKGKDFYEALDGAAKTGETD